MTRKGDKAWYNNKNHPSYKYYLKKLNEAQARTRGIRRSPKSEFKKGLTPWNKGKKCPETAKKLLGRRCSQITEYKKGNIPWITGKKHTDKTKEIMSIKMKVRRKNIIIPIKDSQIEVKIQNFLKQLNIEFYTHQYIKEIKHAYQCDILIPSFNLIIECDGDYWHGNPRKFMFPSREQYEQQLEDIIRTKELIEVGYKVMRLWESDIKKMTLEEFKLFMEEYTT